MDPILKTNRKLGAIIIYRWRGRGRR